MVDVFSIIKAVIIQPHDSIYNAINLKVQPNIAYTQIYNIWDVELPTLQTYIKTTLANTFTQQSLTLAAAPTMFAKKIYHSLWLYMDRQGLNSWTFKNQYP